MLYSIIIPAYNEETRIRKTLIDYIGYFRKHASNFEIIVVCDGSDNTAGIVKEFIKNNKNIRLLEFSERLGKGGAILKGFDEAEGDIIGFVDADCSVPPDCFKGLLKEVELHNFDAAIGSRKIKGSIILKNYSLKRRVMSFLFNSIVALLFNLKIRDINCGAKVFKKDIIKSLMPDLYHRGIIPDLEILWKLKLKKYNVKEFPVVWDYKEGSKISGNMPLGIFVSMIKIRFGPKDPK